MAKELIQQKIDSIQIEQDNLYRFFRAEKIINKTVGKIDFSSWITFLENDTLFISHYKTAGKTWVNYYLPQHVDSLIWINSVYPTSEILALFYKKDSVQNKLSHNVFSNSDLSYDFVFIPWKHFFKVYYLSSTEKKLTIPKGLDHYFLINQKLEILKQETFHDEYKDLKLMDDSLRKTTGLMPSYAKNIPFIFATDIAKYRWYKTDELEYYSVFCQRQRQFFKYDYKTNEITFGVNR